MKNIIKYAAGLIVIGSLTSCVAYTDGYANNNDPYYDAAYSNGYYYAPSSYYGNGGFYGNDGYYYRDNMNYYYDNGAPYYVGQNNRKIYIVKQNNVNVQSTNTNTATFRNNSGNMRNNTVPTNTNTRLRSQTSPTGVFKNTAPTTRTVRENGSFRTNRATTPVRTGAADAATPNRQSGFRTTTPQNRAVERVAPTPNVQTENKTPGLRNRR